MHMPESQACIVKFSYRSFLRRKVGCRDAQSSVHYDESRCWNKSSSEVYVLSKHLQLFLCSDCACQEPLYAESTMGGQERSTREPGGLETLKNLSMLHNQRRVLNYHTVDDDVI